MIRINKTRTGISPYWIGLAFFTKIVAAFVYGYIYAHYLPVSDSWILFEASLQEYNKLLHQPASFFETGLALHPAEIFSNSAEAGWNNTDDNFFIKIVGLLNVLTGGNYYLTALLFSFFSFWGLYSIFQVACRYYPQNALLTFIFIFFIPSNLFWNSGLHKDGLILFFTGIAISATDKLIRDKKISSLAVILLSLFLLFLFRTVNTMLLLPALFAWVWSGSRPDKAGTKYLVVYTVAAIAFFSTSYLPDSYNLPALLAEKQHSFMAIEAGSHLPLMPLEPNFLSYLTLLPQALNHVFLRPYITEINGPLQLAAFLETTGIFLFVSWILLRHLPELKQKWTPFLLFLLSFSLSNLIIIGMTVPFTGGIVRYKSLYQLLLVLVFLLPVVFKKTYNNIK